MARGAGPSAGAGKISFRRSWPREPRRSWPARSPLQRRPRPGHRDAVVQRADNVGAAVVRVRRALAAGDHALAQALWLLTTCHGNPFTPVACQRPAWSTDRKLVSPPTRTFPGQRPHQEAAHGHLPPARRPASAILPWRQIVRIEGQPCPMGRLPDALSGHSRTSRQTEASPAALLVNGMPAFISKQGRRRG